MNDKFAVARVLREIGLYLQLQGDNRFRARAYETGARAVEELREDLAELVQQRRLTGVQGIGPALAAVISELVTTGKSQTLEKLKTEVPPGALELMDVPGLSFKRIQQLHAQLGIDSVAALRAACEAGRLRELKGYGAKTEAKLLAAIARWERRGKEVRVLLVDALELAEPLAGYLGQHPAVEQVQLAGALRRWCETVDGADLLVQSSAPAAVLDHLLAYPQVVRTLERGEAELTVQLSGGLVVELRVVLASAWPSALVRATGSPAHVARLEERAEAAGVALDAPAADEREVYGRLGLPWIAPELREDEGELEAAADGSLPDPLVTIADIRGMTHCHSTYSDGKSSIEEMVREAERMGMEFITITDHSPSAHYAGGVTLDQLQRQWDEIARVQETTKVKILRGTESDILEDGGLDYPDRILEQMDVIIASIHSRFKMDPAAMTARLIRAMKQPVFKIWGHALGRLIMRRDPFQCDVERVLDAVAESRAAIEINGDPYRLDLAPEWIRKARTRNIRFVISTDAHSTRALHNLRFGVHTARRGWLRPSDILNTLPTPSFLSSVHP